LRRTGTSFRHSDGITQEVEDVLHGSRRFDSVTNASALWHGFRPNKARHDTHARPNAALALTQLMPAPAVGQSCDSTMRQREVLAVATTLNAAAAVGPV
jgi:hypothetical protein